MTRKKKKNSINPRKYLDIKPEIKDEKEEPLFRKPPNEGYKTPSMVMVVGDNSVYVSRPRTKDSSILNKDGSITESSVHEIFSRAGVNSRNILMPKHEQIEGIGEIEISDGIVIHGDTAFLLQVKGRSIFGVDENAEIKKINKLKSKADKQAIDSLNFIKTKGSVVFKSFSDEEVLINYADYNWISLIVIDHPNTPNVLDSDVLKMSNFGREVPRVIISLEDLRTIALLSKNIPNYFLTYLRRMQYQTAHRFSEEYIRFMSFLDQGIFNFNGSSFLLTLETAVHQMFFKKQIDASLAKKILSKIDFMDLDSMEANQASFYESVKKDSDQIRKSFINQERFGFAFGFYNSTSTNIDGHEEEVAISIAEDYLYRFEEEIDGILSILIDTNDALEGFINTYKMSHFRIDLNKI